MKDGYLVDTPAPGKYLSADSGSSVPASKFYLPDNLPPSIDLSPAVIEANGRAMHSLGRLDGFWSEIEDPDTAFGLFVVLGVVDILVSVLAGITDNLTQSSSGAPVSVPTFLHVGGLNIGFLRLMALGMLFINSALSSILIRIVDGGTHARDLQDFTLLLWASNLTALGSWKLISSFGGSAGVVN
jgi:hypothetical protein